MKKILFVMFLGIFSCLFLQAQYNWNENQSTDTSNVNIPRTDTVITIVRPTWVAFYAIDSLTRPLDATPYSINDVMTSTTTASNMTLFRFKNVANANGGNFVINTFRSRVDTANATNASYMITVVRDSSLLNHIADNAQNVMLPSTFLNICGEIFGSLQSTGAGTGSTCSWDFQTGLRFQSYTASGSKDIYGKWIWLAAYQPGRGEKVYIEITGMKEVLPQ